MSVFFPEILKSIQSQDLEQLAMLIRKYFGGHDGNKPKLFIAEIFSRIPIILSEQELAYAGALIVQDLGVKSAGGGIRTVCVVQQSMDEFEKQFFMAYALGRFLFDVCPLIQKASALDKTLAEKDSPYKRYIHGQTTLKPNAEELAQDFAACLFLPKIMLDRAVELSQSLEQIQKVFGVSAPLLHRRMSQVEDIEPIQNTKPQPQKTLQEKPKTPGRINITIKDPTQAEGFEKALAKLRAIASKVDPSVFSPKK